MLKRIPIDQLRVGMFLHELCGSWMDHPFWRSRFVLDDPRDLRRLLDSGIREVWIDTNRGHDVAGGVSEAEAVEAVERELVAAVEAPVPEVSLLPVAARAEYAQAAQICQQAKQKVKSLFNEARMGRVIQADGCLPLVDEIIGSVVRNQGAMASLVRLKTQDEYTYLHSVAVCTLMVALGRTLGLAADQVRQLGLAGLLHDMGKARIPLEVLNKPGRLTDAEWLLMKQHPSWGHEMLVSGGGCSTLMLDVCLRHHEKIDGSGYPNGLGADQIPLHAKMGAVCDVYDAITSARPYKAPWDAGDAVRQMAQWKGHFDPAIFQAFVKTVGIYPIGTLVRLQSGRLGVVVEQNNASLLTPQVKVFFSTQTMKRLPPQVLDLADTRHADRITGVELAERWAFKDLNELWLEAPVRP
jgi:HD-GYP domain-containing protein (c-di-GMP phosphodiesterase class II)